VPLCHPQGRGLIDNGGGGWKADPRAQKYFPDDLDLYLLLAASEYLLATKDTGFLQERVQFWNSNETQTVLGALLRSVEFVVEQIGAGRHGLMRQLSSDWDDGKKTRVFAPFYTKKDRFAKIGSGQR
jgi:cellobiose phosphorylase